MVIPKLSDLTVGGLEQILKIEVDEGIVPVGRISTTYEQSSSTHRHHITGFTHI